MGMFDSFTHGKLSVQTKCFGRLLMDFHMFDEVGYIDSRPDLYQVNATDGYWLLVSHHRITGYSKQGFNVYTIFHDYPNSRLIHLPNMGVPFRLGY